MGVVQVLNSIVDATRTQAGQEVLILLLLLQHLLLFFIKIFFFISIFFIKIFFISIYFLFFSSFLLLHIILHRLLLHHLLLYQLLHQLLILLYQFPLLFLLFSSSSFITRNFSHSMSIAVVFIKRRSNNQ